MWNRTSQGEYTAIIIIMLPGSLVTCIFLSDSMRWYSTSFAFQYSGKIKSLGSPCRNISIRQSCLARPIIEGLRVLLNTPPMIMENRQKARRTSPNRAARSTESTAFITILLSSTVLRTVTHSLSHTHTHTRSLYLTLYSRLLSSLTPPLLWKKNKKPMRSRSAYESYCGFENFGHSCTTGGSARVIETRPTHRALGVAAQRRFCETPMLETICNSGNAAAACEVFPRSTDDWFITVGRVVVAYGNLVMTSIGQLDRQQIYALYIHV